MSSHARDPLNALVHPNAVKTNQNSGLIRLLACLFMFIDHAGKMLFPQYPIMRIIGRLAFPMFAYGIAVGAVYTRDPARYLSRVVLLALISQPLYAIGMAHESPSMYAVPFSQNPLLSIWTFYINSWEAYPSILLSLSLSLALILSLRHGRYVLAIGLYVLCVRMSGRLDYGIAGVHLMLLFYLLCEHPLLSILGVGAYMLWWSQGRGYPILGYQFNIRIFALPAALFVCMPMTSRLRLPKWLTYGFYPAHLALLAVLVKGFSF